MNIWTWLLPTELPTEKAVTYFIGETFSSAKITEENARMSE